MILNQAHQRHTAARAAVRNPFGTMDVPDQGWQAAQHEHHAQRLVVIVLRGNERRQERAQRILRFSRGVEHGVSLVQQECQARAPRKTAGSDGNVKKRTTRPRKKQPV